MPASVRATAERSRKIPGEWVIQFKHGTNGPRGLMLGMLKSGRATLKSEHLDIAGAFVARLTDAEADKLRKHPQVRSVEQNMTVMMAATQYSPTWGLDRIDQRNRPMNAQFNYSNDGSGVHIYMVDTGIDPEHPDLGGRVSGGVAVVGDNIGTLDGCSHGTGTAGIAAGATYGVAKNAYIHPVKVVDRFCVGDVSAFIYGLDWIRNNHSSPAVASTSLIFGGVSSAVDSAVRRLVNSGVAFVTDAGNDAYLACSFSPASVPEAIVVAASDSFDIKAGFSNSGPCVDIFAPGVDILTDFYDFRYAPGTHNGTAWYTGTSASAPFVAGAAALYLQQVPGATPAGVAAYLTGQASAVVQYPGLNTTNRLLFIPRTLNVTMQGPSSVKPNASCIWSATASGAVGSPTYVWTNNGLPIQTGSSNEFTTSLGSSGTIGVWVSDSEGASGAGSKFVTVSSGARICRF